MQYVAPREHRIAGWLVPRGLRRVRLARNAPRKMSIGETDIARGQQRTEWAEAQRLLCLLDRYRIVTRPGMNDRAETQRKR